MKTIARKLVRRVAIASVVLLAAVVILVRFGNDIAIALENSAPSTSIGTTSNGRLVNGKRLPTSGRNFHAYSYLCTALGRNSVHHKVREVVLGAYRRLEESMPDVTFVYGECSWPSGGRLRPHATHENGLSVDFMVPVRNANGPTALSTHLGNKFGYSIHFDERGYCEEQDCSIDFQAMAAHLDALRQAAQDNGIQVWRVIFAPDLQPLLFATETGARLKTTLEFSKQPSWVRHDEHYHVDFVNPDDVKGTNKHIEPGEATPTGSQ